MSERETSRFYIVNQHVGWLKQYVGGMDESNWRDMQAQAERQLESLSQEIDKINAALPVGRSARANEHPDWASANCLVQGFPTEKRYVSSRTR